jgi:hypothetical protein
MAEFLFKNISHITYLKTRNCDKVVRIPQGTVYKTLLTEVEESVANEDDAETIWSSSFEHRYKAKKDRWQCNRSIGTPEFIEKRNNYSLRFVDGKWLSMPELTVHFLDQSTKTLYFTTDDELDKYIKRNFNDFRTFSNKKQIKI